MASPPDRETPANGSSGDAAARVQQALVIHREGRFQEAQVVYEEVLSQHPHYFDALYLLGTLHAQCGHAELAISIFEQALSINRSHAGTYNNLGNACLRLHRYEEALQHYLKALECKPDFVEALNNQGNALLKLARYEEALAVFDGLLAVQPGLAEAHNHRGVALKELRYFEQALASYDRALALKPAYAQAHSNRGNALQKLHCFEESLVAYAQALAIDPGHFDAYYNQASAFQELRRFEQALASYDQAIALQPDNAQAHWNKALALLSQGELAAGWDQYEWRWKNNPGAGVRQFRQPLWQGHGHAKGQTLLLHSEQGIGDIIQFGTLMPEVLATGLQVIFQTDARLIPLFQRAWPSVRFMTEGQDTEGLGFDFHCPVGSLARIFRRSLSAFDGQTGQYLQADPARVAELQALHVKSVKPRLQCGITWRSRSEKNGLERSMALQDLVQALHQDGLEFINLQYGDTAAEVEACFQSLGIRVKSLSEVDHFSDLEGLAASIACCDLVITVDNSTAHLAGALGKKTWVLLTHTPDWRWMLDREDSPWYAALQLYRQGADRRWGPVLERVNQDLQKNLCSFSLPSVQSPATS